MPPPERAEPFVALIIATCRRVVELERLLRSLEREPTPLAVWVVDNAADPATRAAVEGWQGGRAHYLDPGANLGCGGGLAFGERAALRQEDRRLTHLWLMDDDTVVHPGALTTLLGEMDRAKAVLAAPMVVNAGGRVGWAPGLENRAALREIVAGALTPEEYLARYGTEPVPFSWATGVSLLVTREAVERLGVHREDFLIRGEDLEFSLRLTAGQPGLYVPTARVDHLPPEGAATAESRSAECFKHRAMVQNVAYIACHLPYGRRILRTVPGNIWRYLKTWGPQSLPGLMGALWNGAVRGKPAGVAPPR